MKVRIHYVWTVCLATFATATVLPSNTLHVKPADSLSTLGEKLANDAGITEVIFEEGVYSSGLHVSGPKGIDFSQRPLVLRPAEGARVLFDGARAVERFQPHAELAGMFQMDYEHRGGESPKLWEPGTRMRYRLVANLYAAAAFLYSGEQSIVSRHRRAG